jgi:dTDP-4-amino-4,6-dideoxygalactose transaminase
VGSELDYVREAIASGHLSGNGPFTRRCHAFFEERFGVARALLTTSCTHALEMAALLLDVAPGDEVLVPSFTFVSTVNAFVLRRARPVFVDVRPDTLNLDEAQLELKATPRTRVILPVHYAGVGCEMDAIAAFARSRGIHVVEDNAQGLFGTYRGKALGTFGALSTVSFHDTKNITCGEGGVLFVNDARFADRAEIIREKGTNRSQFFRGQVDKYTWVDLGSSYLPSELCAAFLLAQLERAEAVQAKRRSLWARYAEGLADWARTNDVRLPAIPAHCEQTFHIFYLLLPSLERRTALAEHLKANGVAAAYHYVPLHLSEMGKRYGGRAGDCPVSERVADTLLRLPMFYGLERDDQDRVLDAVRSFRV